MRYFIEVSYKGTSYAGFQIQQNATTIQSVVENAMQVVLKLPVSLTGSSRTDAGVHALQNYFHTDLPVTFDQRWLYNLNSVLPRDIVIRSVFPVPDTVHCRFDALYRRYTYYISVRKNPFKDDTSWFFPYSIDFDALQQTAALLLHYVDFTSFSKLHTQAFTNDCTIMLSEWRHLGDTLEFTIQSNRFLRGMVRGLVGTMMQAARRKISVGEFEHIIIAKDCSKANFATPAHGLFLEAVGFSDEVNRHRL